MFACFLKRALPFSLTLLVGSGLGSLLGGTPRMDGPARLTSMTTLSGRHSCGMRNRAAVAESTPLIVTFEPEATVVDRITTLPDGLTEEAERAAERTVFRPATINGRPYTVTEVRQFSFSPDRY
jgi:hypothetical protein